MPHPLLDTERFAKGLTFEEYLSMGAAAAKLQRRRFDEDIEPEHMDFLSTLHHDPPLRGVILATLKCSDCAWAVPYLSRLLQEAKVEHRVFLKDDFPDLMDRMTTRGKRSTPKLALLDSEGYSVIQWGPRPDEIQRWVETQAGRVDPSEWRPQVFEYYRERGVPTLRREMKELLEHAQALRSVKA